MSDFWNELFMAPPVLPTIVRDFDLLRAFVWYISAAFVVSLILRLRFYRAVYLIAQHVSGRCPNVHRLIHEHWFLCMKDGVLPLVCLYLAVLAVYMGLNRWVWPTAAISLNDLFTLSPTVTAAMLSMIGMMLAVDAALISQIGRVDVERVKLELSSAEWWLGGNLNAVLQFLGKWNPIMKYAGQRTREQMLWFNCAFRGSLVVMVAELILRMVVAVSLFACYVLR